MAETPESQATRDQTEVLEVLVERLDEALEHLAAHVCCVCKKYYGSDREVNEDEIHAVQE